MSGESVSPDAIVEQRAKGWPDFHPEAFCHQCGRPNIHSWFSPEWVALAGSHGGILCPVCFAALDPDPHTIWVLTRWQPPDADELARLIEALGCFTAGDDEELRRVASCLLDAGYHHGAARACTSRSASLLGDAGTPGPDRAASAKEGSE